MFSGCHNTFFATVIYSSISVQSQSSIAAILPITCFHSSNTIILHFLNTQYFIIIEILLSKSVFYNRVLLLTSFSILSLKPSLRAVYWNFPSVMVCLNTNFFLFSFIYFSWFYFYFSFYWQWRGIWLRSHDISHDVRS